MFSKTRSANKPQRTPEPIPPLPDLPSPGQSRRLEPQAAASPVAAPASAPIAGGRGLSTLSTDLAFEGNVSGAGDFQVDGGLKGDIRVARLIIGETGSVEGGVTADYVEVRGRIVGAVNGKQVKLLGTAYVDGDITHEQLSIDVGAYFQGRCIQSRRDAPQAAITPAPRPTAPVANTENTPAAAASAQPIEMKSPA